MHFFYIRDYKQVYGIKYSKGFFNIIPIYYLQIKIWAIIIGQQDIKSIPNAPEYNIYNPVQQMAEELKGFAVQPKLDCPHLSTTQVDQLCEFLLTKNTQHFSEFKCAVCEDKTQNWICLECKIVACSRYVKGHMAEHHQQTNHSLTLSFSDSSFWCYQCDSYIDHPSLIKARKQFSKSKFAAPLENEKKQEKQLQKELNNLNIVEQLKKQQEVEAQQIAITYEYIIDNLKNKKFKKIVLLTGAGLSVAAGIPDFRTPGTGLYDQLAKENLPRPQSVFELSYYAQNPYPFIKLSKEWKGGDYKPTDGHKFIKKLEDEGILHYCMTQNIDDLETKAGIPPQKLLQAHGHSRSAHCIKCKKQQSIQQWEKLIDKLQVMRCSNEDCKSFVKPDIVFFGQQLPPKFYQAPQLVEQADLVFVIGTSLVVWPFAFLAHNVPPEVPLVLINNQDSLNGRKNKLWMEGDIQQNIRKICKDLNWEL